jgi:hypothetical protein
MSPQINANERVGLQEQVLPGAAKSLFVIVMGKAIQALGSGFLTETRMHEKNRLRSKSQKFCIFA